MSKPGNPAIEGLITKGEYFDLDKARQVAFDVRGTCDSARSGYIETTLEFLDTGGSLVIGRSLLHSETAIYMAAGATLFLPRGRYRFTARVRAEPGGSLANPDIQVAKSTINYSADLPFAIGQAAAAGSHETCLLVSVGAEMPVNAVATIREKLAQGEYLTGSLTILDTASNKGISTPRAMLRGMNLRPLQLEASSIFLKPGTIYRFSCDMIFGGEIRSGQSVSVS